MNLVGIEGKGESVWLGFFLYTILKDFKKIARLRDENFAMECMERAEEIKKKHSCQRMGWPMVFACIL
jgi:cellobiose phosphorylase